jgi:hypothetical protein
MKLPKSESHTKQSVYTRVSAPVCLPVFNLLCFVAEIICRWPRVVQSIEFDIAFFLFIVFRFSFQNMDALSLLRNWFICLFIKKNVFLLTLSLILKRGKTQLLFQNQEESNLNLSGNKFIFNED